MEIVYPKSNTKILYDSEEPIRTFLALPVDEKYYPTIRSLQSDLVEDLQSLPHAVRWTKPQRLHLTLFFLGRQSPEKLQVFIKAMKRTIIPTHIPKNISLSCSAVQLFPHEKPTVIALTGQGSSLLQNLRHLLHPPLKQANIVPDVSHETQGFLPHITLGTLTEPTDLKTQPIELSIDFSRMILFHSKVVEPHSVTHIPLYTWLL